MATYTIIADSEIDPESPGTTTLFTKLRDNPIAITEKASGAPVLANDYIVTAMIEDGAVTVAKLSDYTVGNFVESELAYDVLPASSASYKKYLESKVPRSGTIRVRMGGAEANPVHNNRMKIYINGGAVGAERIPVAAVADDWNWWNEDIAVNAGDLVQVYAYETGATPGLRMCMVILCDDPSISAPLYNYVPPLNKSNGYIYDE